MKGKKPTVKELAKEVESIKQMLGVSGGEPIKNVHYLLSSIRAQEMTMRQMATEAQFFAKFIEKKELRDEFNEFVKGEIEKFDKVKEAVRKGQESPKKEERPETKEEENATTAEETS